MKPMIDFLPDTPTGFHLRVEDTLMSLEEKDMNKKIRIYSRRMVILVAAAMILIFTATAFAVVQGNALKTKINQSGGADLATQVKDVHVMDNDGDFSFTIDEILWQGENMYFSYTVTVPDDGNTYLYSLDQLKLGDEAVCSWYGLDSEFFVRMFAAGGDTGTQVTDVVRMYMKPELQNLSEKPFEVQCVFMQANRPIQKLERDAYEALFTEPDSEGNANQLMKNADVLYYTDVSIDGDPAPVIQLHGYPEVRAVLDANNDRLTPQDMEELGIAEYVDSLKVTIPIRESEAEAAIFNDVAQHVYPMDGYAIEITKLNIDSFNADFEAVIRKAEGEIDLGEWTGSEPYARFYTLCKADGSEIGDLDSCMSSGYPMQKKDETVYIVDGHSTGLFKVKELDEIFLAPELFDENGEYVSLDMSRAIKLDPIYNPDLPDHIPEPEIDFAESDDLSS